jgi:translin
MRNNLDKLSLIAEKISIDFTSKDKARETIISHCRDIIRYSANGIRAIHRHEYNLAEQLIGNAGTIIADINIENTENHIDLLFTGPLYDAHKEFAEASITLALLSSQDLPDPDMMKIGCGIS